MIPEELNWSLNMHKNANDNDEPTLIKISSHPISSDKKKNGIFSSFKKLFLPLLKKSDHLLTDYSQAKVKTEQNSAEIKIEEAIQLSAKRNLVRQEELKLFCEIVSEHFSDADTNAIINLKMAKLLETNPDIERQIDKVNTLISKIEKLNGKVVFTEKTTESSEA